MNIFDALETRLEPKFNNIKFRELEPTDTVKQFCELGLLKQVPIDKFSCDQCWENCRGLSIGLVNGKLGGICPSGFLETPHQLTPDETQGWQFDFNRLAELICAKSNLVPGGEEKTGNLMPIAYEQINGKNMAVIYGYGFGYDLIHPEEVIADCFGMFRADELFIVVPSNAALLIGGINSLRNTHLITLKNVLRNNFDISDIIKRKISESKATSDTKMSVKFPTPDGTTWDNTTIEFITEDGVKINMPGFQHPYTKHFSVMGFQDTRRTSQGIVPDKAWRVFRLIAQNQGEWTLGDLLKKAKVFRKKKGFDPAVAELSAAAQKEEYLKQFTGITIAGMKVSDIPTYVGMLRKRLKEYFGINDDPFYPYYARGKKPGYQAKFKVFCSYKEPPGSFDTPADLEDSSIADENSPL
ncbi:MAG: hypothetical protein HZA49_11355 [Planctomycetes bacterium]|nr:hypothetical protein [Planctomycetota bacterium]